MKNTDQLAKKVIALLRSMIKNLTLSKDESVSATIVRDFLTQANIAFETHLHNTWCYNKFYDAQKPTILLNSHIDTVKIANGWTEDALGAAVKDGKLFGLGSNDAGGALVSLLATFLYFNEEENLPFNLCWAATAEEEISGKNGIASIAHITSKCAFGIIGEPTEMALASSEKGLMVVDAEVKGKTGHAARDEGINALYLAVEDIAWIRNFRFEKEDAYLGPIKMTVTMIESGYQHNVVPDICKYVIDIRTVDTYSYEEIIATLEENCHATFTPRSTRLRPSSIGASHEIVQAAKALDIPIFGSSTLSDQALLKIPTIKMGPGKSARSHTPNEFIYLDEIKDGIKTYIRLLEKLASNGN